MSTFLLNFIALFDLNILTLFLNMSIWVLDDVLDMLD